MSQKNDSWDRLRFIGYCWAKLPPEGAGADFDDFVQYAKFQLCSKANRLMKDPIWDEYRPEEILIEYYALLYHNNEKQAEDFLKDINGINDSDYDWILDQAEQEEIIKSEEEPDSLSFEPDELGG